MPIVNVKRFSRSKVPDAAAAPAPAAALVLALPPPSQNNSVDEHDDDDNNNDAAIGSGFADDNDLFADLGRNAFEASQVANERAAEDAVLEKQRIKEEAKNQREMEKKLAALQKKAASKKNNGDGPGAASTAPPRRPAIEFNDDSVFSDQGSEILGRDKRQLITKVVQYKQLFPTQLKTFKVKKNANVQELREALTEMEVIVQTSSLDEFVIDSILATLKLVEGVSSYSTYSNISGLAEMLRLNPQFNSLVKQLYIKYNTFSNVPPEQQLAILVITSAYVCVQKNKNRAKIDELLNQPVLP